MSGASNYVCKAKPSLYVMELQWGEKICAVNSDTTKIKVALGQNMKWLFKKYIFARDEVTTCTVQKRIGDN